MKKILLVLMAIALGATGCQCTQPNNTAQAQSGQVDWTRGGGAIGLP